MIGTTSSIFDDIIPLEIFLLNWFLLLGGHWKTFWQHVPWRSLHRFFLTFFLSCNKKGPLGEGLNHPWETSELWQFWKVCFEFDCVLAPYSSPLPTVQPDLINVTTYTLWCFQMFAAVQKSKVFCTTSCTFLNNSCSHWKGSFVSEIHWY